MELTDKGFKTSLQTECHMIENVKQSMNITWRKQKLETDLNATSRHENIIRNLKID